MAQKPQIIDITKSYLPCDPNSFVQNLVNTDKEDGEEKALPILPYEGYNFLPTSYGYKSYFGTNSQLEIGTLTSRAQALFVYQLPNYQSRLIALCEDGIWVCDANVAASTWTHSVVFNLLTPAPFYDPDVYEEWTWCVIENVLYMYQQGRASAWKTAIVTDELAIQTHTPTFLTMAGQMGIFKAGLRLGFWDSANSISWSSNLDLTDFTPALENLAGNTIFGAIVGRIVAVKSHGEGFIVYTTKTIVGVTFSASGNLLWDAKKIFDNTGISHSRAVTSGKTDTEHFVYSNSGIYRIGDYNVLSSVYEKELIVAELFDLLEESRDPVYLNILQSRYLCFSLLNPDYINGRQSFKTATVDPYEIDIPLYESSETYPTGELPISSDPMWDIIRDEMVGHSPRKVGKRFWVPLFTTTVDRMNVGHYARWMYMRPGGETAGLLPYSSYDVLLDTDPITDVEIAALTPDDGDSRHGTLRTFTGIRAFAAFYGGDLWDNNEALVAGQMSEWEGWKEHLTANKERLESLSTVTNEIFDATRYDAGHGYTVVEVDGSSNPTHSTKVLGTFVTGEGSIEWLFTKGPVPDSEREAIMRKTFNKAYEVTEDVKIVYNGTSGDVYQQTAAQADLWGVAGYIAATHSWTGGFVVTRFQNSDSKYYTYTVVGDPSVLANYTQVRSSTVNPKDWNYPGGYTAILSGAGIYFRADANSPGDLLSSADGRVFSSVTFVDSKIFDLAAEFLSNVCYYTNDGLTTLNKFTATGSSVGASSVVTTTGLTLLSTDRCVMFKLAGILYLVQNPSTGSTKLSSSSDGVNWTLVGSFAIGRPTFWGKATIDEAGYFICIISTTVFVYKVTATEIVLDGTFTNPTDTDYYVMWKTGSDIHIMTVNDNGSIPYLGPVFKRSNNTQDSTKTYTIAELTVPSGYSQFRALVTRWDLIEPGLYGAYTIIRSVAASAMTPKVWEDIYPDDTGDETWTYSTYKAVASTDGVSKVGSHAPYSTGHDVSYTLSLPGSTFLLQTGSVNPSYPTFNGFLVYDLQLKKWGKYKGDFKALVETPPINSDVYGTLTYTDLGVDAGIFDASGNIYLFDSVPTDSWIRWGKIGYYRLGFTNSHEVKVTNRYASSFRIETESSLDGKVIESGLSTIDYFTDVVEATSLVDISARWHTVKISGNYDLTGLEFRGTLAGRR